MKKNPKKILVLGSGALKIGEAGEFDYSGSQAIKALKEEGSRVILVNPNIATIQTSPELTEKTYLLPVEPQFVEKVIMKEKPDGILLSFGGQTALNCGLSLSRQGVLKRFQVKVLGTPIEAIEKTEDRELFKKELAHLNLKFPRSISVSSVSQGQKAAQDIGFPLMLRVGYALGGLGSSVVKDEKEFREKLTIALAGSGQVLIEEYLHGWKEIEYEVVRDKDDNCITVCNMENMDPMGIHTGESIVVAPSQTLTNFEYQFLRNVAIVVIRALGIIGESNIQFALDTKKFDYRIIEVNARLSRSSALASKATGYPLAYIAAKLALGYRLDQLPNAVTKKTAAFFEPSLDYIVVKIPRWDLDKFKLANQEIGSEMKSVGEVMAIGRSFEEAVQKAVRMLDQGYEGVVDRDLLSFGLDNKYLKPSPQRLFHITRFLISNVSVKEIAKKTAIDPWFIGGLKKIADAYGKLTQKKDLSKDSLRRLKELGYSDAQIASVCGKKSHDIRTLRKSFGILPQAKQIDTLGGEFPAGTNYLYMTYLGSEPEVREINEESAVKMMVLGSGAYRIGSSVEFDWCAVNTVTALRNKGFQTIMVNCNPETVSTDYDYADILYFEELTAERVFDIWEAEQPQKIVLSVGGQIPNNLASFCEANGMVLLGSNATSIQQAEDRHQFSKLLETVGVSQPPWNELTTKKEVLSFARNVGYPVMVRPSFVLSGTAMSVLYTDKDVSTYIDSIKGQGNKFVVTKFIDNAREMDFDGVAKDGTIVLRAISEHIERAGVHSGDSTLVLPPYRLGNEMITRIDQTAQKITKALAINGPFNIQFLERGGHLMVIECNLRASRSLPFVSKVLGINFIDVAVNALFSTDVMPIDQPVIHHVGVKAAQFSFSRIKGADPVLRVEMASTGEVATLGTTLYDAYLKSLLSVGMKLPKKTIFLSIGGWEDKETFFPYAEILSEMGFSLVATEKTHKFLTERGIKVARVNKLHEGGEKTIIDLLKQKEIELVINTTESSIHESYQESDYKMRLTDGYYIRRTAVDYHIPLLTNLETAMLFVRALKEMRYKEFEILPLSDYSEKKEELFPKGKFMPNVIHGNWRGKHIVSVDQFSKEDLTTILNLTKKIKAEKEKGIIRHDLDGKIMAAIFYEASSRTFGSFITAMQRLGGGIIPLQGVTYSSVTKGELLPDTIRTFANYADVIVLRHPEEGSAKIAASYSSVPIINAGDGIGEHPTQALLDLFTITEHFNRVDGLSVGMVGDLLHGRTIHSLTKLLGHFKNISLYFASPDILRVQPQFKAELEALGLKIIEADNLVEVIKQVDVLYMTRVQKERFADLSDYEKVKNYYILTPELLKRAKKDMIIMHPFPRVGEISYDVDIDPRAVYIRSQMQNGLFVRMALLLLVLGKNGIKKV